LLVINKLDAKGVIYLYKKIVMRHLCDVFEALNIDYSKIGFYDSQEFREIEEHIPSFLEKYAEYIKVKTYSKDYLKKASLEIPFIAHLLNEEIIRDGRLGACIDASMVLTRILEKEGYWNYLTKGSLTIMYPKNSNIKTDYFWFVDDPKIKTGHSWVVAPPFTVIDITTRQQVFKGGQEKYIPKLICSTSKKTTKIYEIDLISPVASAFCDFQGIKTNKLNLIRNDFKEFIKIFPPYEIVENQLILKYVTVATSAPAEPLEEITSLKLRGKFGYEIYNEIIKPKLSELRNSLL